jgi:glucose/arabinose dehydrogenase
MIRIHAAFAEPLARNNAQNRGVLLGKILRIDVDGDDFSGDANRNYAIPASHPFVKQPDARPEIWAYGLRNPWRCSFDSFGKDAAGELYLVLQGSAPANPAAGPGSGSVLRISAS